MSGAVYAKQRQFMQSMRQFIAVHDDHDSLIADKWYFANKIIW